MRRNIAVLTVLIALIVFAGSSTLLPKVETSPAVIYSDPKDGSVCAGAPNVRTNDDTLYAGDELTPFLITYRAFVKFSLSGVSGTLHSAKLNLFLKGSYFRERFFHKWDEVSPLGNPGLGDCLVRHIADYGSLDVSDFDSPSIGNDPGVLIGGTATPNVGYVSINIKAAVQDDMNNGRPYTTFMIQLSTKADYDGKEDGWVFSAYEAGTDKCPNIEYTMATTTTPTPVPFDFSLTASPASQTVEAGGATAFTATATLVSGSPSTVTLSISGLPAGAASTFNPAEGTPTFSSTITITTGAGTALGTYTLTITGSSGGLTKTATVTLEIQSHVEPDFELSVVPASQTATPPQSISYALSIIRKGDFSSTVGLTVSGLPAGVEASFNPQSGTPDYTATLTLTVTETTPPGTYVLTIYASGGGKTKSTVVTLMVQAAPTPTTTTTPTSETTTTPTPTKPTPTTTTTPTPTTITTTITATTSTEKPFVEEYGLYIGIAIVIVVALVAALVLMKRRPSVKPAPLGVAPEVPTQKFCINCGTSLAADAQFCAKCGSKQT